MDSTFLILLALVFIKDASCQERDYRFHCQPKPGCTFKQCNEVPQNFLKNVGFDLKSYRQRNKYHITCVEKGNSNKRVESGTNRSTFKCKPNPGCDFSSCDPIPPELIGIEGFSPEMYRQSNEYFISCEPTDDDLKPDSKKDIELLKKELNKLKKRLRALETKSVDVSCPLKYKDKCFIGIVYNAWNMTYADAWKACHDIHAKPAGVYSIQHFDEILKHTRQLIPKLKDYIDIWLGMYLDEKTKNVMLRENPETLFTKWLKNYPDSSGTRVALRVQKLPFSSDQGMMNIGANYKKMGVLCEK